MTPPAGLGWTPPINVYLRNGVYSTDYDATTPLLVEGDPGVTTYYVDADTGSEANPGTSALPKASLRTITSSGMGAASKLLVKARGKFYYTVTGSAFNYAGQMQVEAWGGAECRITQETAPSAPWVWTDETGGVWSSPIPAAHFAYTTVVNSTDIESTAVYPQAASLAACQATPGTVWYQTGSPNKYYVHTAAGTSPATGHLLIGGGGNACESVGYGYNQRIQYRNVNFVGGDTCFVVAGVVGATTRRLDFIGCKFVHARTGGAFTGYTNADIYLYQCIAGPTKFDGFSYGADTGVTPRPVEIECIGRNCGLVSTGANQGSTIHSGTKILRVNGQYYGNADQEIADVNANTTSWNVGCAIGPERMAGRYGFYCGNDGGNTQMYLEGCPITGMTYQMHANTNAHIWFNNMPIPTTATTSGTGVVSDYAGTPVVPYVPPVVQPSITAVNANFTVAASPVTGWTRITKVGGTNGVLERAAETTQLLPGWAVFTRDVTELAYFISGVSKAAGPYGGTGIYGIGPNSSGGSGTMLYFAAGSFSGSSQARQTGVSYGTSRNTSASGGYPGHFNGDVSTVAALVVAYGLGTPETGNPVIFDCMIAGIGDYIDVKIT